MKSETKEKIDALLNLKSNMLKLVVSNRTVNVNALTADVCYMEMNDFLYLKGLLERECENLLFCARKIEDMVLNIEKYNKTE